MTKELNGGHERAVTRKPDGLMGPQAGVVEAGGFTQSIVASAMRIAGEVVEEFEFAKDGEVGISAEGLLEFGQGGDFVPLEVFAKDLGIEEEGSHNIIVPIAQAFQSEL